MKEYHNFFLYSRSASSWVVIGNIVLLLGILTPLCVIVFHGQVYNWSVMWDYREVFFRGWLMTIIISAVSFFVSSTIGILCALAKRSSLRILRYLATGYIELIRGTPLLVQILFFFYVFANALGLDNRYVVGIAVLSIFSGAYLAEIFRAGIESVSSSQLESAKAIGLTKVQTYRYVIYPQAFRVTLPPLSGQFASLIKDSSLLSIIGINEFTYAALQVNSTTYSTLESFIPLGFGYLLLTLPISVWSKFLEKKFLYET
jgi:polar amino acid transport system permease protein